MKLLLVMFLLFIGIIWWKWDKVNEAMSCPAGTTMQIDYYIPIVHQDPFWIQQMPVYKCV